MPVCWAALRTPWPIFSLNAVRRHALHDPTHDRDDATTGGTTAAPSCGASPARRALPPGLSRRRRALAAEDKPLDALIGDTDRGEFGQDFDQASRTIHMPKATAPTLSPATAQPPRQAVEAYDDIVARGGWPQVPKVDELRLGDRHPSVVDLRARLVGVRRSRSECGRQRHLRFLRRGGGAAISGPPRADRRRHRARGRRSTR